MNFQTPIPKKRSLQQAKEDDSEAMKEEEYLDKMEKIIKRDFFPELKKIDQIKKPLEEEEEEEEALDMKLNEFIHQVKSEDNEIFKEIIKKEDEAWRKRMWWMFMQEQDEKKSLLALENNKQFDDVKKIENKEKSTHRMLTCPHNLKTHFMFFAEAMNKTNSDTGKKIYYENTRFEGQDELLKISQKEQKKQIMNNLNNFSTPALVGLKKQFEKEGKKYNLDSIRSTISEFNDLKSKVGQNVNGYSMLDMPSPNPSQLGSPIMTYGQVEDTPVRIEQRKQQVEDQINNDKFILQRRDKREEVAKNLSDQISYKKQKYQNEQKQSQIQKLVKASTPKSVLQSQRMGGRSEQGKQIIKELMKLKSQSQSAFATPSSARSVRSGVSKITAYKKLQ